jgi:hypothetical protein
MFTELNPPVIERADLILGNTMDRKQVLKQNIDVQM